MSFLVTLIRCLAVVSLATPIFAESALFYYNLQRNACNWGSNWQRADNNTNNGGLCAYVASINRVYACPAPDPTCWTWYQTCKNNNGTRPGADQIQCTRGSTTWCCQSEETCTVTKDQINICISQFYSPNSRVSVDDANAKQFAVKPNSSIPTTAVTALPSILTSATFVVANLGYTATTISSSASAGTSTSVTTTTGQTTSGTPNSASSSPSNFTSDTTTGLSGGVIAGIVVGVIGALAVVAGVLIVYIHRKRRARGPNVAYNPVPMPTSYYEKSSMGLQEAPHTPPRQELAADNPRPNGRYELS